MAGMKYVEISLEMWGCVFCLLAAACLFVVRKMDYHGGWELICMETCNALLLLMDALAWGFRGNTSKFGCWMTRISNFMVFALGYLLMALATAYFGKRVSSAGGKQERTWRYIIYFFCILSIVLLLISQFTHWFYDFDAHNLYYRKELSWMLQVTGIIGMMLNAVTVLRNRKIFNLMEFSSLLFYIILPTAATTVQIFVYGFNFINLATTIALLLIFVSFLIEQSRRMLEQERKLNMERISTLRSQIQPHFLFNCLATLRYLCRKEPEEAITAIDELSGFLRDSIESLSRNSCVPFEKELDLVKHYLYLEQKRFGDKLNIEYDIRATAFQLPLFSMQPIVENAVRHGLRGKDDQGTLQISTTSDEEYYAIHIKDDGIGFTVGDKKDDHKQHVGIENVRSRLHMMCGGTLQIDSQPGRGTEAVIYIPKNQKEKTERNNRNKRMNKGSRRKR
ncbi:MAG: sensor histidine kinase [Lachnospiraceae bacterium]